MVENAKSIIDRLNSGVNLRSYLGTKAQFPKFSSDIEDFIGRRKPQKYTEEIFPKSSPRNRENSWSKEKKN